MRAPDFWAHSPPALPARLLSPLGAAYGAVASARLARQAPRVDLPTIVIGGLTLGGDGKTPLALALASILQAIGERPFFLSRGYGRQHEARRGAAPFLVDPALHGAAEAGDEPLLLARRAPAIVGVDRVEAARLALRLGATALILDDGLHSRQLAPDLALLAVDAAYGAGNGLCPPAGPLRAPLAAQLAAADALVIIGAGAPGAAIARQARDLGRPVLAATLAPAQAAAQRLRGARVLAFAGIARPRKFLASLREAGATVVAERRFADHHAYRAREIAMLRREAEERAARLVTTEKDAARLSRVKTAGLLDVETLPVELALDPEALARLSLGDALDRARRIRGA